MMYAQGEKSVKEECNRRTINREILQTATVMPSSRQTYQILWSRYLDSLVYMKQLQSQVNIYQYTCTSMHSNINTTI